MGQKFKGLKDEKFLRGAFRWMGLGFEFAVFCGIGAGVGYWLDTLENTSPGWLIMGFFAGFGTMFYLMLKRAKSSNEEIEKNSEENDQTR
jgi:F0F1-type ATP synthase assembly protein I